MLSLVLAFLLATPQQAAPQTPPAAPPAEITWKAVLMTGDDSIDTFDNARKSLKNEFIQLGIAPANIRELSMSRVEQQRGITASSGENFQAALLSLSVRDTDGCLIHMTSHGTRQGFAMSRQTTINPARLNSMLEFACGDRPTVVLVSACYSGSFTGGLMPKPNRVILTAARDDRTSFGCSAENEFTYWDGCLIDNLAKSDTWRSLQGRLQQCIEEKESKGRFTPSLPQAFFGDQVADLKIPGFVASTPAVPGSSLNRCPVASESAYGFSVSNAVKVGLDEATGPARETQYLSALRGPAGQAVRSSRIGSALSAGTVLHIYELSYEGLDKPQAIYLDVYHFETPKAPVGFTCSKEIGL
jgi:hypothetical protein